MHHVPMGWRVWTALILLADLAQSAPAQLPLEDPVEELRDLLGSPLPADVRAAELGRCVDALRTLDDLRRALTLAEWHNFYKQGATAAADEAARRRIAQRFVKVVRQALARADVAGQVAVIDLLGSIGEQTRADDFAAQVLASLAPDLAQRIGRGPEAIQSAAAKALGVVYCDHSLALPTLKSGLSSASPAVRLGCTEGLQSVLGRWETSATRNKSSAPDDQALAAARTFLPAAARGLGDTDVRVRRGCTDMVATIVAILGHLTNQNQTEHNNQARTLLADCSSSVPALARALCDSDRDVQASAARAFEEMFLIHRRWSALPEEIRGDDPLRDGLRAALPTLRVALDSVNVLARRRVVEVLEIMGPESTTTPLLIRALADTDRFVRWVAVRSLADMPVRPRTEVIEALTARLQDSDLDIRRAAARGLEQLSRRPITDAPIRVIPTGAEESEAAFASTVAPLWRALLTREPSLRTEALQALRQLGTSAAPAMPVIAKLLRDQDAGVRKTAAEVLGNLGARATPSLAALQPLTEDQVPEVRQAAREAVVKILRQRR